MTRRFRSPTVAAPLKIAPETLATEEPKKSVYKTKEEKRLEAEARNRLSQLRQDLKKKVTLVETQVHHLESEKAAREQELCEPETCKSPGRIKLLNQELRTLTRELEDLYENWHGLAQELEEIVEAPPG